MKKQRDEGAKAQKKIREHHDRTLPSTEIGSCREDKSEEEKRQGLGCFTLAPALAGGEEISR
jgi:hypothetical protein